MKKGFTLIELLVVVLIIGILSAIALPRYQAAVDKAALTCVMPILRSVAQAQDLVYMENGGYPPSGTYFKFSDLSIAIPATNWEACKDTDNCVVSCAGRSFLIFLRDDASSKVTWANFYWGNNDMLLKRLRFLGGNNNQFSLQCPVSGDRCNKMGKSMARFPCTMYVDTETTKYYCW